MPNWKKLVVSGSNASLNNLTVNNAVTASAFVGDGSGLSNLTVDIAEQTTVSDSFTSTTSHTVTHNFGTKNVIVQVFDNSDNLIIPSSITTTDTTNVEIIFSSPTSGRVVVAKGGHLVTGELTYRLSVSGSSTYPISHSLNEDFPIVQVYNTERSQVIPAEITTTSANALDVTFNSTFSGTVVVKK